MTMLKVAGPPVGNDVIYNCVLKDVDCSGTRTCPATDVFISPLTSILDYPFVHRFWFFWTLRAVVDHVWLFEVSIESLVGSPV